MKKKKTKVSRADRARFIEHICDIIERGDKEDMRFYDPQLKGLNRPLATIRRLLRDADTTFRLALAREVELQNTLRKNK